MPSDPAFEALRTQARAGGLRFEAYLPPDLADWLLGLVEEGAFTDPSEAVFVMAENFRELEPHRDLRDALLGRMLQAAIDDPRPRISSEELAERLEQWRAEPRPEPARWVKP